MCLLNYLKVQHPSGLFFFAHIFPAGLHLPHMHLCRGYCCWTPVRGFSVVNLYAQKQSYFPDQSWKNWTLIAPIRQCRIRDRPRVQPVDTDSATTRIPRQEPDQPHDLYRGMGGKSQKKEIRFWRSIFIYRQPFLIHNTERILHKIMSVQHPSGLCLFMTHFPAGLHPGLLLLNPCSGFARCKSDKI